MQGYKTIIVAAVSLFGGLATMMGVGIPADTLTQLTDSVTTLVGGGMALSGIVMAILRFITTTPVGAQTSPMVESGAARKEGGFARIGVLLVLAMLAGCAVLDQMTQPLHAPVVGEAGDPVATTLREAHNAIDEANAALIAFGRVINNNIDAQIWTKAQAQTYQDQKISFGAKVDRARQALRLGNVADAKTQAEALKLAILAAHREIAKLANEGK